jgi:subtilisin-like proprotein convertase family protein/uncharacterized cupredoxin-like copper-binding protein
MAASRMIGVLAAAACLLVMAAPAGAATFSNTTSISVHDADCTANPKPSSLYPSNITVSGMTGTITDVNVTLSGVTHPWSGDLEVFLVGPAGVSTGSLVLLADTGGGIPLNNGTLTFDDGATSQPPQFSSWAAGTYRPTDYADTIPEAYPTGPTPTGKPAPTGSETLASKFNGTAPNGTWSLYVFDDACGDAGTVGGGWSLTITSVAAASTTTAVSASPNPATTGQSVTTTATVTSGGNPVTSGTVTFTEGATTLASNVAVNGSGQASFSKSNFTEGDHTVTATYNGTASFATSNASTNVRLDNPTTVSGDTFCNTGAVTLPTFGSATPYPSNITVSGKSGTISKLTLQLKNVTHNFDGDFDVLLVGPTGANLVVLSDAGTAAVSNVSLTFDDAAPGGLSATGAWGAAGSSLTVKPTNFSEAMADSWPSPAPSASSNTTLGATFDGSAPNGVWKLYVIDDAAPDGGTIAGGWCLNVTAVTATATTTAVSASPNPATTGQSVTTTATVTSGGSPVTSGTVTFTEGATTLASNVAVNGSGQASFSTSSFTEGDHTVTATYNGTASFATSNASTNVRLDNPTTVTGNTFCNTGALTLHDNAASAPYPSRVTVSGISKVIGNVAVTLKNVSHSYAGDVEVLLVGPTSSRNVILASDAGSGPISSLTVTFDDAATGGLPASGAWGTAGSSLTVKPTNFLAGDTFPAPAPTPGSYTTLADAFNDTTANGTWSLYVIDDALGDAGSIAGGWCLTISGPPDVTAPVTTVTRDPASPSGPNSIYTDDVHVTVAGSDDDSGVEETRCVLDPSTAPATFADIPAGCDYDGAGADVTTDGEHTVYAATRDNAGNSDTPVSTSFVIDKTAPTVSAAASPASIAPGESSELTWSATEDGAFSIRVDGTSCSTGTELSAGDYTTAPADRTATIAAADLAEGANTLRVCVVDAAGHTGSATAAVTKTPPPDLTAPVTTITRDPASPSGPNGFYTGDVHVTVAGSDGDSGVEETRCVLDPSTAPATFADIPTGCAYDGVGADVTTDGEHTVYAATRDNAGNSDTPVSSSFVIDKTSPTVSANASPPSIAPGESSELTWSATEDGAFSIRVGGTSCSTGTELSAGNYTTAPADRTATIAAADLAEGANTLRVCVVDAAGHTGSTTATVIKTPPPDVTAPVTTITRDPASPNGLNGIYTDDVHVTVAGSDSDSGLDETRCVLDPSTPPATFADIPAGCAYDGAGADVTSEGEHTVYAASRDNAGNSGTPVSSSFVIDKTTPTVSAAASPASIAPGESSELTWSASEDGAFSIRVGGTGCATGTELSDGDYTTAPADRTATIDAADLVEGANTLRVCVVDAAGHTGSATATVTKTPPPDLTAPVTTVTRDPASPNGLNGIYTDDVHVTVAGSDSDSGLDETRCVIDPAVAPATFADIPAGCAYDGTGADVTSEGEHTVYAASRDNAGNAGTPVSSSFVIDKTTPNVSASAAPASIAAGESSELTWSATEDGAFSIRLGGTSCSTGTELSDGDYTTAPADRTATIDAADLAEGANTLRVCVVDAAGHSGSATATVTKTPPPDLTAPVTTITRDPAAPTGANGIYTDDVHVTVAGSDGDSGLDETRCVLDPSTPPATFADIPAGCAYDGAGADVTSEGEHTVYAASRDNAGNAGTPVSSTFVIDKTTPTVSADASPHTIGPSGSSELTWSATEDGAFSIRVGGTSCATGSEVSDGDYTAAPADRTKTIAAADLAAGANTVRVCVVDAAGHTGSATTTVTKTTPPTVPIEDLKPGDPVEPPLEDPKPTQPVEPRAEPLLLTDLRQSAKTWRTGSALATVSRARAGVGTTFTFKLNRAARVYVAFIRVKRGRKVGSRCVARTRRNAGRPRCKRPRTQGVMSLAGHAGTNRLQFAGRLPGTKRFPPGRYTIAMQGLDGNGVRSAVRWLKFRIVAR